MTKLSTAAQKKLDAHIDEVVGNLMTSRTLAVAVFGDNVSSYAVKEIADYLADGEIDPEELTADLKTALAKAKLVYETTAPNAEDVFDLFERLFVGDDDDDDDDDDE